MSEIIAYKDQNNEYFDFEIENSKPVRAKSEDALNIMRHDMAHILAEAVESIYPGVKFGIGPPISNGFYYDIDFVDYDISKINLDKIENKFNQLVSSNLIFERSDVSKKEAIKFFNEKKDPYKLELIKDLEDGNISFYKQGNFTDLCKGPHIPSTKFIKSFKILNIAGAYWRGDENNKSKS